MNTRLLRHPARGLTTLVALSAVMIAGCGKSGPSTIKSRDGQFQITVYGGMTENSTLNEAADIQAANIYSEMYAVVLSESKVDFEDSMTLADYRELSHIPFLQSIGATDSTVQEITTVHGDKALQCEIHATVDGIKVGYVITHVDTGSHFHQVLAWTLESRFDANRDTLIKIAGSLQPAI